MIKDEATAIDLLSPNKSSFVTITTNIFAEVTFDKKGRVVFRYPNDPRVVEALDLYFKGATVPAKQFAELCKTYKSQMFYVKNGEAH
jgi:hypothetical protein